MSVEEAKEKIRKSLDYYEDELKKLRGGNAGPALVEKIQVEVYDDLMTIDQLGTISMIDPTLLVINVWDRTIIEDIKKAIETSDVGINPLVDGPMIRLPIPPMSRERREEMVKLLKEKAEDARIAVRQIRKDCYGRIDREERAKELSEDEADRGKKDLQKTVDEANKRIEEVLKQKEDEMLKV